MEYKQVNKKFKQVVSAMIGKKIKDAVKTHRKGFLEGWK